MKRFFRTTDGRRSRGQIVVIFAGAMTLFVGLSAIVIDVSWYWSSTLRMQRAADAAALAGVVWLPGNVTQAVSVARAESAKNGYTDGVGGYAVTPTQDSTNNRRLKVRIDGNVGTFFARALGIQSLYASVDSKAEYVLPVPMGSPENYYGVFGKVRHPGGGITTTDTTNGTTSYFDPTTAPGGNWTNPSRAYVQDSVSPPTSYATKNSTTNPYQLWGGFATSFPSGSLTINGIEVEVIGRSADTSGCQLRVALNWNGTSSVTSSSMTASKTLNLTGTFTGLVAGSPTDTWGRTWTASELSSSNLRVRLEYVDPGSACTDASEARVDHVHIRFHWTAVTTTFTPDTNLTSPYGAALNPRGFWGTMLTQGAETVNGDAYMPFYDTRTGTASTAYGGNDYYDYAVDVPAGGSAGEVWIFDPGFCAVASDMGTGDRYFGSTNTNGSNEVSAYYILYDTKNTLYDTTDDTQVASSGTTFANMSGSDPDMNGPSDLTNLTDCSSDAIGSNTSSPFYYHNRWWQLASGLAGGKVYRVRTTSTDPSNINAQKNMNGQNSFAIWTRATGATPKVHGLGAMEAYTPLEPSGAAEFYLAQIEAVHAGKTMEIKLWDPGDTNSLSANLQIRIPTTTGYTDATLNYTAAKGTTNTNASNCNSTNVTGATSIPTNTGGSGGQVFNGCWVTIVIPIPATYSAPTPPGETQPGWWKIRYNMGSGSSSAFDLTTWQVAIRGNPVHLILP